MRTKSILFFILMISLSYSSFSQKRVTIKQTIISKANEKQEIIVSINTDCKVTIKGGNENAVYLIGEIKDSNDYKPFCIMNNDIIVVNSPFRNEKKDYHIVIELNRNIGILNFGNNSNVVIQDNLNYDSVKVFRFGEYSNVIFEDSIVLNEGLLLAKEFSRVKFSSITANNLKIFESKGAFIELNGTIDTLFNDTSDALFEGNYKSNLLLQSDNSLYKIIETSISQYSKFLEYYIDNRVKSSSEGLYLFNNSNSQLAISTANDTINNPSIVTKSEGKVSTNPDLSKKKTDITLIYTFGTTNWVKNIFEGGDDAYALNTDVDASMALGFRTQIAKNFELKVALGWESMQFEFKNCVDVFSKNADNVIQIDNNPFPKQISKLVVNYVTIPIVFNYQFHKNWTMSLGATMGVNFSTKMSGFKKEYMLNNIYTVEYWGSEYKNLNPIKLDIQYSIGWSILQLYFKYSLTPIFKKGTEMNLYPYGVGISFGI